MHIVDRRLNPKAKSLGNRQRFLRRARGEVREAVREALKGRKVAEVDGGEKVRIRTKSLKEPSFRSGRATGERDFVLPGNREYMVGDSIRKPDGGAGGRGNKGSPDGEGEDDFVFSLSREEFLDLIFEDLKLPNLVKARLKDMKSPKPVRAGFVTDGPPARLNLVRTMRNSLARRVALRRPSEAELQELERLLGEELERSPPEPERIAELEKRIRHILHLRRSVAYIDPIDLQFNRYDRVPKPSTQAVMFCLMDVSASMTEELKDLAKRFFMLLHLFLTRHYREVDVVFIRHTTEAKEVDEESFFKDTETGGTVISSALQEMQRIVAERYPVADWNIYAAEASDGHNFDDDMDRCCELLTSSILPLTQYFAYIEVNEPTTGTPRESIVWSAYSEIAEEVANFAMQRASSPADIYPVFRELFSGAEKAA
ncbi:MAG: YeaH/YhbH family protein [Hyphomicrobiaceae bacterium]